MPKYEIGVYNKKVRELVAEGSHHRQLDDSWADIHYIEVKAQTAEAARAKILASRSQESGYVIESVDEIESD